MGVKTADHSTLLKRAESYLRESVSPLASEIDRDSEALRVALQGMGNLALLALKVPQIWGGAEVSEATYRRFQQLVPRYSGALAFLQTQHQSAGAWLANSDNESLKQQYLPRMSRGEVLVGVGFSQLRRQGTPLVQAIPVEGGYQLMGIAPWVTGWGFFDDFIVGAVLPDGQVLYGIVPLTEADQKTGGTITCSPPMELAAMTSTNTISATLNHWFLPTAQVVSVKKAGFIDEYDQKNVLNHGFFALGCAQAGLDILEATAKTKSLIFIQQAFDSLNQELRRCQSAMMADLSFQAQSWDEKLNLRSWAIHLAGRCAMAAITVSSGAANRTDHPAQRVYREAVVFTVSGQTTAVMAATLARLIHECRND